MIHNPRTCNAFHSDAENVRDSDDIMAIQAEDGLYTSGSPDVELFVDADGNDAVTEFVGHLALDSVLSAVTDLEDEDPEEPCCFPWMSTRQQQHAADCPRFP